MSYGVFISQLLRLARVNSILSGFKTSVTEFIGKLIAQGFKLAALRNKFVKFYESKLNIWGKYGVIFMMNLSKCFNHLRLFCNLIILLSFVKNPILSGFKTSVTEFIGKLIAQGFKLAALRNKFVKFYKSKLNIWGKYGSDIYDEFIEMFQSSYIIL